MAAKKPPPRRRGRDLGASAKAPLVLCLPWPPRELSPNARVHWAARYRAAHGSKRMDGYGDVAWGIARAEMQNRAGEAAYTDELFPLEPPVTAQVVFVVPDRRRRDFDNLMAMLKPAWDGFVTAGLLVDDSSEHLKLAAPEMRYERGVRYVEVTLR